MKAAVDKATQGIREQAADWAITLQDSGVSHAETLAFVGWLRASPVHIREYLRAEAAWLALEGIDAGRRIDVDALLQQGGKILSFTPSVASVDPQVSAGAAAEISGARTRWWSIAAAILIAAIAVPLVYLGGGFGATESFMTALGEQRTIVLEDGSVMELNTASDVEVRFSAGERNVRILGGEAFFTVKKDPSRPFRVYSNGVEVTAVGTQFNVYRQNDQTAVTVLEGRVQVQRAAEDSGRAGNAVAAPFQLGVGDHAVVSRDREIITADAGAMNRALAWRTRELIFADEPLVNVVAEINRYNARQLIVHDGELASRRISGVFNVHDPEVIVRFLTRSEGVGVTETPEGAWILASAAEEGEDGRR